MPIPFRVKEGFKENSIFSQTEEIIEWNQQKSFFAAVVLELFYLLWSNITWLINMNQPHEVNWNGNNCRETHNVHTLIYDGVYKIITLALAAVHYTSP